MVYGLVSLHFDGPQLGIEKKTNCTKLWLLIQRYAQFWFFRKGFGNSFPTLFCVWFFKKNVFHVILYQLTKFHLLIDFTSWDIVNICFCDCLLTRSWNSNINEVIRAVLNSLLIFFRKRFYTHTHTHTHTHILAKHKKIKSSLYTFC